MRKSKESGLWSICVEQNYESCKIRCGTGRNS